MATEVPMPIKGFSEGFPIEGGPSQFSGDMNNMRPISTLTGRIMLCQRPGQDKKFALQLASVAGPIVVQGSVSVVS